MVMILEFNLNGNSKKKDILSGILVSKIRWRKWKEKSTWGWNVKNVKIEMANIEHGHQSLDLDK